jgi:multidrug efflux pump subunit AcrA (membrane-fusion protein)
MNWMAFGWNPVCFGLVLNPWAVRSAERPQTFEVTEVPKPLKMTIWLALALVLSVGAAAWFTKQQSGGAAPSAQGGSNAPPAIPVTAEAAKLQDVPIIIRGLGTVAAYNTVSVKSRVIGNITQINFREGQEIKTGDLLVQLGPARRPAISSRIGSGQSDEG